MAKEDLLSKQINQLGFFLGKLLEKLKEGGSDGMILETVSQINADLKETLGFNLEEIEKLKLDEVIPFVLQNDYFSPGNLELFADILSKINSDDTGRKALKIYEYIDSKTATFSMERNQKMRMIKNRLS